MRLRVVMDTNVLYAGVRSRQGASFQILQALEQGAWTLVLSHTLLTEYEEILKRETVSLGLSLDQIDRLLDSLCLRAERWPLSENWVPVLTDADDEALVHLSVESRADHLVSHNIRHLEPARRLGVKLLEPKDFLTILRS